MRAISGGDDVQPAGGERLRRFEAQHMDGRECLQAINRLQSYARCASAHLFPRQPGIRHSADAIASG
jgi:hypothetical protein